MNSTHYTQALFSLGQVVATPAALEALATAGRTADEFISRHVCGDWGDLGADDTAENQLSLAEGLRIFSSYAVSTSLKVWVITEADRSATCILLPSDY